MADKKSEKKRAIVEEVSAEPENEETIVTNTTEPTENIEPSESVEEEADEPKKEEHLKKVEAPAPPPSPMNDNRVSLKVVIFLTAFVAVIVGGLIGGVIVFVNSTKDASSSPSPSSEASLDSSTEPSAAPATIDKNKYTVDILNGSGIAGQGAAVQKILTDGGFKVGTVGNAKTFDYTKTVVQVKSTVDKDYLVALEAVLTKNYVLDKDEELAASAKSDLLIIVGSQKAP